MDTLKMFHGKKKYFYYSNDPLKKFLLLEFLLTGVYKTKI